MLRRFWRSTFGVVTAVALLFTLATVAVGLLSYDVTHEALEEQLDHRVAVETRALLAEADKGGVRDVAAAINRRAAARSTSSLDYLLVDPSGRRVAGTVVADHVPAGRYEELLPFRRGYYAGVGQALVTPIPGGRLIVIADRRDLAEIDRTLATLFTAAMATLFLAGVAAAAVVGWLTRRRLARIDRTALAITNGNFEQRIPRDHSDSEFDRLAATLNAMLDRIAALMDNLRQVSSDVAHDLRTPLTRLYGQLDRAAAASGDTDRDAAIEAARVQAADLLEMFGAILRIAEVEGLTDRRPLAPVDVTSLLDEMAETYRPDLEATGHHLSCSADPGLVVRGDRRLLAQAISNLLENAMRHTPTGTEVTLAASTRAKAVVICVADNGPGVAEGDAERLFARFARSEASRTTPGHGLGLALVKAVALAHGGTAETVAGKPGFGVTMTLPSAT